MTSSHKENKSLLVIGRANIDKIAFIIVFQHFQLCRMLKQEQFQCKKGRDTLMMQIRWFRLIVNHLTATFQVSRCIICEICWHWYTAFPSALQTVAKWFSPQILPFFSHECSEQTRLGTKIHICKKGEKRTTIFIGYIVYFFYILPMILQGCLKSSIQRMG